MLLGAAAPRMPEPPDDAAFYDAFTRGTTSIQAADEKGWLVSVTPSGGWVPAVIAGRTGIGLSQRAQSFVTQAEDGPFNVIEPGKRPRSSLSVGIALRDGDPYLVWGTPGGDQQDQWNSQFFLRHVHFNMNLQEAIDAPAWHIEHFPASFWPRAARPGVAVMEGRLPKATIEELKRRGHKIEVGPDWSEGRLTAASRDGVRRRAAANPRGMQGYAAGR